MILALALSIAFVGGDDAALARSIAAVGARNVVLLAEPSRRTASYRHDFDSETGVRAVLGRMYDLGWQEDGTAYSDKAFPIWVIFRNQKDPMAEPASDESPKATNGRVTFANTDGKTVGLKEIATLFPKGKLTWSWFFDDERFALAVKDTKPRELLSLVAKAGGGRIVEKGDTLRVELDPTSLRKRSQTTFSQISTDGILNPTDVTFMQVLYASLTDNDIRSAYEHRSTNYQVPLRTSRLQSLALRRAQNLIQLQQGREARSTAWMKSTFDFHSGLTAIITPNGPPQVRVQSYDGKSALDF